jgi:cyclopentanol dehydrogenase
MRLSGKVALITGAATGVKNELMGIGGAAAWLFAREGARLALGDVNEESGRKTAAQLRESGADAIFLRLDVTVEEDWTAAVKATASAFGGLDILVNNAGMGRSPLIEETTVESWDQDMAVNARGTFLGTKHAVPEIRKRGGGSIINISSIAGLVGLSGQSSGSYAASKGAVRLLTKATAVQYARDGIRCNSIHPGFIDTPMTERSLSIPENRDSRIERTPLSRIGTTDDIAYGVLYLASDESSFVTGSELVIDGGYTAQ